MSGSSIGTTTRQNVGRTKRYRPTLKVASHIWHLQQLTARLMKKRISPQERIEVDFSLQALQKMLIPSAQLGVLINDLNFLSRKSVVNEAILAKAISRLELDYLHQIN